MEFLEVVTSFEKLTNYSGIKIINDEDKKNFTFGIRATLGSNETKIIVTVYIFEDGICHIRYIFKSGSKLTINKINDMNMSLKIGAWFKKNPMMGFNTSFVFDKTATSEKLAQSIKNQYVVALNVMLATYI